MSFSVFTCHLSPVTSHQSPVTCHLSLALPCLLSQLCYLGVHAFTLKPLEALLPGELDGTTDTRTMRLIDCISLGPDSVKIFTSWAILND